MDGACKWLPVGSLVAALWFSVWPGSVFAQVSGGGLDIGGRTIAPAGYADFCRRFPAECQVSGSPGPKQITRDDWNELRLTNEMVNHAVEPRTDRELYGIDEYWTIPDRYGDCEDYALLKRKLLIARGWGSDSVLVTVVFDELGDGHAVLIARIDRGDFVLDNKIDEIRSWRRTKYRFVKQQSASNPTRWVRLGDPRWESPVTAAQD